jgi:hypothetical protein
MASRKRPFWPAGGDSPYLYPVCGVGPKIQYDQHALVLFPLPPRGIPQYGELISLSRELNKVFKAKGMKILDREKKKSGIKDLQITVAEVKGNLCLSFVVPYEKLDKKTQYALRQHIEKK